MRPVEELLRGKSQFSQDNSGTLSSPPRQSTLDKPSPGVVEKVSSGSTSMNSYKQ